jgi:penicillin-binding protein 2
LFDRERALASLAEVEPTWGGDYRTRMAADTRAFDAAQRTVAPPVPEDAEAAQSNVADAAANADANSHEGDIADTGSPDE